MANKDIGTLQPSERLPVLFLGHGSPMTTLGDNEFRRGWQKLGMEFGTSRPRPQLILCISAHWLTQGWWLTAMQQPQTIHDFGGFPQELFDQQYPAPGSPQLAQVLSELIRQPNGEALGLDQQDWGFDHGCWGVLKPMFPQADIAVIQLSMDYQQDPAVHYALAKQLRPLREQGVLIVASGNFVHNLRLMQRSAPNSQAFDWTREFDQIMAQHISEGRLDALQNFRQHGQLADLAHPTWEHFLPLLYAAGAVESGETVQFFNDSFQAASTSMRSVVWG
ncbi:MAG: 4,5-DOPA dioxygenase extradiol [Burkholderiaceae bacterium]